MSDYCIRFIPDDPYYELNMSEMTVIKSFAWFGDSTRIKTTKTLLFARSMENNIAIRVS